jgi:hypothetical protein
MQPSSSPVDEEIVRLILAGETRMFDFTLREPAGRILTPLLTTLLNVWPSQ